MVREHPHEAADLFVVALGGVEHGVAGAEDAGVHAHEREVAAVAVVLDLERERRQRLVVGLLGDRARDRGSAGRSAGSRPRISRQIERGRQVVEHAVEQVVDALVLERGADERRHAAAGQRDPAERRADRLGGARGRRPTPPSARRRARRSSRASSRARGRSAGMCECGIGPSVNWTPNVAASHVRARIVIRSITPSNVAPLAREALEHEAGAAGAQALGRVERRLDGDRRGAEPRLHLGEHALGLARPRGRTC